MVQIGEKSLGPSAGSPPPQPAPAPGVGAIRVEVSHDSVCWDTTPDGLPEPHRGATVRVRASDGTTKTGTTDINGQCLIEDLPTGSATVDIIETGYTGGGPHTVTIPAGGTEMLVTSIQLSRAGSRTVCNRRHTPIPPGAPTPGYLSWIFWHSDPMIWLREFAWLLFLATFVTLLVIGIVDAADGTMDLPEVLPLAACFLAASAYVTHVIFGMLVGIPTMVIAGLAWVGWIVVTILAATGALPIPIALVSFPSMCGMWICFFVMLIPRFGTWKVEHQWWYILLYALISAAVAILIYCLLAGFTSPAFWAQTADAVGYGFAVFFVAWAFGIVSGAAGHVFRNDHNLESFTAHGDPKLLPFAGYRFCVQGNRGWFSHFDNEVLCYDFAVPEGTPVLAIEEGHVIAWRDDRILSYYRGGDLENFIWVEHRDGSVARYLHLKKDGVRNVNPVLVANSTGHGPHMFTCDVHVHAGQVLAEAGDTGVSRFPHIHLGLYERALPNQSGYRHPGANLGLTFRDASTALHGNKCYTFRPYQSDNANRGPISI